MPIYMDMVAFSLIGPDPIQQGSANELNGSDAGGGAMVPGPKKPKSL